MSDWIPGMVSADEARLCSLIETHIAAFGQFRVDAATIIDVWFGSGAYGSLSGDETIRLICEDYGWTYGLAEKNDEGNRIYWWTIYGKQN